MKKCTGNNTREWGFDAIFEVQCKNCGTLIEFFKDEITRICPEKDQIGVDKDQQIAPDTTEAMCNPVLQTMILNNEKTDS